MRNDITLRLTPAQTYYLRELIATHADCGQNGWAELKTTLDANCVDIARNEMTFGPIPVQNFRNFNSVRMETEE